MSISRDNIEKTSFFYSILKPYVDFVTKLYFKTKVHNFKNVPKDEIIIFTPNHQNALMDALAVLANINTEPIFLARADIFKKKSIAKILTFLRILPIYRIRDGKENLGNNEAIFKKTISILKNKNGLVILPEGTHGGLRKLKTLKKGISRIVFEAEEANNFNLNIKIIPVGLDWSNYINFRSKLFVNFGEPINVSEFYDEYKKNPPRGMNLLRERVAEELKKYIIHIESDEFYDMINNIRYIYLPQMSVRMGFKNAKQPNQFYAQKEIINKLNGFIESNYEGTKILAEKTARYSELIQKLNFRNWIIQKPKYSTFGIFFQSILMIIVLPFYIIGGIINYLPYKTPVWLTKKIKDPQFVSSVRDVVGLIVFPIYYIILTIVGLNVIEPWWLIFAIPTILPLMGLFAFQYYIEAKKMFAKIRYNIKTRFKNQEVMELKNCYEFICNKMDSL
jgi:1-acyl-sn-glycerol-3-phosphate acyltransferase